jgi:hypothetical protein
MVPANRVDASSWEGGDCYIQCSLEERLSMRKGILTCAVAKTQENIYMNEWDKGIRKKV